MNKIILGILIFKSLASFSQSEANLPFSNLSHNSMSIRPLNLLEVDFAFRLYANNGRSLDRIITLTYDSIKPLYVGDTLIESSYSEGSTIYLGLLFDNENKEYYYNIESINSERINNLLSVLKNINFNTYSNRTTIPRSLHSPYSSYTIEIVKNNRYHTFKFITNFPEETNLDSEYEKLEGLLIKLFPELTTRIELN
jgi:hypothetical protein